MMSTKKRFQLYSLVLGSAVALAAFAYAGGFLFQDHQQPSEEKEGLYIGESPAKENPTARLDYEREMLVDPATGKLPTNIRRKEVTYANEVLSKRAFARSAAPNTLGQNQDATENSENSSFIDFGPYNIGGRTRGLAIDVTDENTILAGGISGGIWRSTDAGQSWAKTSSPLDFPSVTTLVQDQRTGHTTDWYFGGGEFFGNSASEAGAFYFGDGLYRSTDGGLSWAPIAATATGDNIGFGAYSVISEMAIDNSNNGAGTEIYVAGVSQIILSTTPDFSNANTVLGLGNQGVNFTDVLVSSTGRVFASIANSNDNGAGAIEGIFTSPDGTNWADISPPQLPSSYIRIELALDPSDENLLYAVGGQSGSGSTPDFLLRYNISTDTWTDLTGNLGSSTDIGEGHNMQEGYNLYIKVHPDQSSTVFVGGTNVLRSVDAFGSSGGREQIGGYQPDNNPNSFGDYTNHHPDQHAAVFLPSNGNIMITGSDGGVHRTENNLGNASGPNPVGWTSLNNGYYTTQFYAIDYLRDARGDRRLPGGMQDNGTWINYTSDVNGDWVNVLGGDGAYTAITYNALYASAQEGQIRRYTEVNNSNQFTLSANIEPSADRSEFLFINPFIVNPVNQDQMFIGGSGQVFYTDDIRQEPAAGDWETFSATGMAGERVSVLAASIQPSGVLYVGTRNGEVYKVANTREITNAVSVTDSNMPADATVSSIAVDPQDADRVLVTFSNYNVISIWLTEDGGTTWTAVAGNLEENADGSGNGPSIRSSQILPDGNGGRMIFVGTSVGLFMTTTTDGNNTTWEMQSENKIGKNIVSMIKVRPSEGQVLAATHGNGIFSGTYDVVNTPTINYSVVTADEEIILRGPTSTVSGQGFTYQWLRNNEVIADAINATLTITNGGTYKLRLTDETDQSVTESNELVFFLDSTAPNITSILRLDPVAEQVEVSAVTFQVTFDEAVDNVNEADFEATGDVTGSILSVVPVQGAEVFDVTINSLGGQGILGLGVVAGTDIADPAGNAFSGTITTAETYTISDQTAPTVTIARLTPLTEITNEVTLTFAVTFNEPVTNVDLTDFGLSASSVASASIESVTGGSSPAVYSVVVSGITETGLVDIDIVSGNDVTDLAGNAFSGTITSEETYTIDNITSIDDANAGPAQVSVKENPSEGIFVITLSEAYTRGFELVIVSGNGSEMLSDKRTNYLPGTELELDLRNWPDGLYLLTVASEERKDIIKLLKRSN